MRLSLFYIDERGGCHSLYKAGILTRMLAQSKNVALRHLRDCIPGSAVITVSGPGNSRGQMEVSRVSKISLAKGRCVISTLTTWAPKKPDSNWFLLLDSSGVLFHCALPVSFSEYF